MAKLFFCIFLLRSIESRKRTRQISSHLDQTSLVNKGFITYVACVAWRFSSNLRAIGKRESRDEECQSREEPGRETTEKLPARMAGYFC